MRAFWTGTVLLAAILLAMTAALVGAGPSICKSTDAQGNIRYADCPPKSAVPPPPPLEPAPPAVTPPPAAEKPKPAAAARTGAVRMPASGRPGAALAESLPGLFSERRTNLVAGVPLLIVGVLLSLGGSIGYVIEAFRVRWWWGLGCLFFAPASVAFLILHWRVARKPFLISLVGMIVAVVGVVVIGVPPEALSRVPLGR